MTKTATTTRKFAITVGSKFAHRSNDFLFFFRGSDDTAQPQHEIEHLESSLHTNTHTKAQPNNNTSA